MDAWSGFALSIAVKVTVVLAVALALTRIMRRRSAAERHLVWAVAAAGVLAVPLFALMTPVEVRAPAWLAPLPAPVAQPAPAAPVIAPAQAEAAPAATLQPSPAPFPAAPPAPPRRSGIEFPLLLFVVWGSVAVVLALRLALEFARVHRIARRAHACTDPALLLRARGIASALGVERRVQLLEGDEHVMPMTFGVFGATLLLPAAARTWSRARRETVLRHELAHIRRHDSLTQLIAELGCVIYWFQPLMWWAARSMRAEREHACDDAVIMSGTRATEYAAELLEIARVTQPSRVTALAAIAMARPSQLRQRLSALLDERARSERVSARLFVPAWAGALLVMMPVGSLTPSHRVSERTAPVLTGVTDHSLQEMRVPAAHTAYLSAGIGGGVSTSSAQPQPAPQGAAQESCLGGRLNNVNNTTNNERRTIKWSGTGCSGEVLIEGAVRFDPGFTRITGLDPNGIFRLTTEEGRVERRLVMRPAATGVSYEYSVDGQRREFDAAGQRWLDDVLLLLFRRMGFMAPERANAILARGGANALLTEVGLLNGDYVRAAYLEVLVANGRLDEATLRRVLTLAGNTIDSDHYRTQIVTAVAGRYQFTDGIRSAYIDAVSAMDSDHYRHAAFSTLLTKGQLTSPQVAAVLRQTNRIDSDHYRASLLQEMEAAYRNNPDVRAAYLDAAAAMDSDHYKAAVMTRLLSLGLTGTELGRVAAAAATIESDHYLSQVLTEAATRNNVDTATIIAMLDAANSIESDHYRSQLLISIASKRQLTSDVRTRFMRVMDGISSTHYRGQVADVLLRQSR